MNAPRPTTKKMLIEPRLDRRGMQLAGWQVLAETRMRRVMQHFSLRVPLNQAGYYETAHHKELMKDVRGAINRKITVSKSLSVEKRSIKLATLIAGCARACRYDA